MPEVYAVSADGYAYLQEDLGDVQLFQAIASGRQTGVFSEEEKRLLRQTLRLLPRFQFEGAEGMDFGQCYPQAEFDRRCILWDLNYFKYCFLKATHTEFDESRLEDDFEAVADQLLAAPAQTFMYRDFQSRNGHPCFIDFQGGRKGPIYYDVASFLWQAKANLPAGLRMELIGEYLDALKPYSSIGRTEFLNTLRHFVLFRILQVLGAYGFRGYFERKPHFMQSIPYALRNLQDLLKDGFAEYPYLCRLLQSLSTRRELLATPSEKPLPAAKVLTVEVVSFSYRKGIPGDDSGNGGGYVFDCRAVHNPGRYEAYRQLTGRDAPVVRFLEEDGEILRFLEHVDALVDTHVARYLERGFTHLCVCFGCTGGQHRSVYSAQHVAEHLNRKFGVRVRLIHREQHTEQIFEAR